MASQSARTATFSGASSSSSALPQPWKYDVFMNFRGEDCRNDIVSQLRAAFELRHIKVFNDAKTPKGKTIRRELDDAIEVSRVAVVLFTKTYASSTWCLRELIKIFECREKNKQIVIPVFYHIDPATVRKQTGTYKNALDEHFYKGNINADELQGMKACLTKAANLAGWDIKNESNEFEFVQKIVRDVSQQTSQNRIWGQGSDTLASIRTSPNLHESLSSDPPINRVLSSIRPTNTVQSSIRPTYGVKSSIRQTNEIQSSIEPNNRDQSSIRRTKVQSSIEPTNGVQSSITPTSLRRTNEVQSDVGSGSIRPTSRDKSSIRPPSMRQTNGVQSSVRTTSIRRTNEVQSDVGLGSIRPTGRDKSNEVQSDVGLGSIRPTGRDKSSIRPPSMRQTNGVQSSVRTTSIRRTNEVGQH